MFDFILGLLNEEKDVFRGGYVWWFDNNGFNLKKVDEARLDVSNLRYTPMQLVAEQETPFVEANSRSDYVRAFRFLVRIDGYNQKVEDIEEYQILRGLKDKLHGAVYQIEGKKYKFKTTYPQARGLQVYDDSFWADFDIQITSTEIVKGYFADEIVVELSKDNINYFEIDWIECAIPTGSQSFPIANVFDNQPTKEKLSRYITQPNLVFNYINENPIEKELYDIQMGKGNPNNVYNLRITKQNEVYNYDIKVIGGSPMFRRGGVDRVSLEMRLA